MRSLLGTAVLTLALPLTFLAGPADAGSSRAWQWEEHDTPSTESLRGLDAVDADTAWVAGDGGGVWRTTDGGSTWADVAPAGSAGLAFRDVEARSAAEAVVLAIGEGDASRTYRTTDGGRSWTTSFVNDDPAAFYDCLDFFAGGRRGQRHNGVDASGLTGAPGTVVAVGPNGSDVSHDAGRTWSRFSGTGFHSVVCVPDGTCWASGSGGRVARLR